MLIKIQKKDSRTTLSKSAGSLVRRLFGTTDLRGSVGTSRDSLLARWICTNASATALCWAEGADETNGLGSSYDVVYKKKQHGLAALRSKHCPGLALALSEYEYGLKVKIQCTIMLLSVY